jgi:hypothetical protein
MGTSVCVGDKNAVVFFCIQSAVKPCTFHIALEPSQEYKYAINRAPHIETFNRTYWYGCTNIDATDVLLFSCLIASCCCPRFGQQQKLSRFTLTSHFKPERRADIVYMTQEQTLFHTAMNSCHLPHTSRIHHPRQIQNRVPIGSTAINDSHSVHYDPHQSLTQLSEQTARV